jgi:hypothetical protein
MSRSARTERGTSGSTRSLQLVIDPRDQDAPSLELEQPGGLTDGSDERGRLGSCPATASQQGVTGEVELS